jgi:hypothetical protein
MLMVVLCLVVVAAGVVVGCGKSEEKLQKVSITLSQYLKGATGDFDDATINAAAEGAGEGGANTMFMAFTPSTAGLPKGTKYENLKAAQKDAVQATAAAYFDNVQAATPLYQFLTSDQQDAVQAAGVAFFNSVKAATDAGTALADAVQAAAPAFFDSVQAAIDAGAPRFTGTALYANLTSGQKDAVRAAGAAFFNSVKAAVYPAVTVPPTLPIPLNDAVQADAPDFFDSVQAAIVYEEDMTFNPAYVTLHELQGMTWFGLWADPFVGFSPVDAFWKVLPDPAGRGSKVEYLDAKAEAAYGTPADDPVKIGYAQITDAQRAALDAALATFLATMQTQVAAANAAAVAAGTAEISAPGKHDDAFAAAMAAYFAVLGGGGMTAEAEAAFTLELQTNWPADYAAMAGAGQVAMTTAAKATDAFVALEGPAVAPAGLAAAEGWKTDVKAGVHPVQAFKRWMVKPALVGLMGMGLLIQVSVAEFTFKITNPNDYDVSIDTIDLNVSCNANGYGAYDAIDVDAAKMALHDAVWVPAIDSIDLHIVVPMKTMDILTWMIVGPGFDATKAGTYAADVWGRMKAGTAVWDVTLVTSQSHEEETILDATYTLKWTPPVA